LALFWALAFASALAGWMQAWALHAATADDAAIGMAALARKRLVARDVASVLQSALAKAEGRGPEEKIADAVMRLQQAERYLESAYGGQAVALDVFFGFRTDAEDEAWLDDLARQGGIRKCPRCLDLDLGVLSVLSSGPAGLAVTRDGLHRFALPFLPFGRPSLGAVYGFGPVLGVADAA